MAVTATWHILTQPRLPQYWRAAPAVVAEAFSPEVSSMTSTAAPSSSCPAAQVAAASSTCCSSQAPRGSR